MREIIYGNCPSKSNCYKVGSYTMYKSNELKQYERDFAKQCIKYRNKNITGEFELVVDVYYDSKRPDLDNAMKVILDCLQTAKAIKNDNKCIKIIAAKKLDKNNPRIEFELTSIN